ncbi:hypothetical protein [Corynebacterium auriscanis]|uniref:hypothetical protein n=1 Tax=Corynebacterium auriscanis TaxID=99807 RepID=UPI000690A23D|nr:hypothetical protein [Corynebacterium auriscanis]WJY73617.1 hypothetical protein CAURIC_10090 [Corynebacterium auriscanis]
MGRLLLLVLIIITIVLLWKAFGPGSGQSGAARGVGKIGRKNNPTELRAKGPDDDPDFLWNIEKERFKQRREAERQAEREAEQRARRERLERLRRQQQQRGDKPHGDGEPHGDDSTDGGTPPPDDAPRPDTES